MGEKSKGFIAEAELNMSDYGEGDYNILQLPLKKCDFAEAYIVVGIRGTHQPKSGKHIDAKRLSIGSANSKTNNEEYEKLKKEYKRMKDENEKKIQTLHEKVNNLGTSLENTKTELSH